MYYLIDLEVQRLKWVCRAAFLLETLEENLLPCLFKLLETAHIPWLRAPSSICKTSSIASFLHSDHHSIFWPSCLLLLKNPMVTLNTTDNPGMSPHLEIFHLITSTKSLLPHSVTYLQVQTLRCEHLWSHFSAYHGKEGRKEGREGGGREISLF